MSFAAPRFYFQQNDLVRVRHMLDSGREALSYIAGHQRADLEHDRMLVHALVRCIEIIGEAASRTSAECRTEIATIPWIDIVGMRNRLIHAYFDINLDLVWDTVQDDLPPLIAELEKIVPPRT
jgi:uncharacterized protein with HEPN domain